MAYALNNVMVAGLALVAGAAVAQNAQAPSQPASSQGDWVPPGTPGSPIDGEIFHAQVLLDAAGFPAVDS